MAINPNIALSVQGLQLADPLAQYGKVMAIQGAQSQNQLAQMQVQQAQREREQTNALNRAYSESISPETGQVDINRLRQNLATSGMGAQIPKVEEQFFKSRREQAGFQKTEGEVLDDALKRSRGFLETLDPNAPDAAQRYLAWNESQFADPVIGPALQARGITPESVRDQLAQTINQPGGLQRAILQSALGIEKFMEMNKPQLSTVDIGGEVQTRTFQPLTGEIATVDTQRKTISDAERARLSNEAERIRNENRRLGLEERRVLVAEDNARREADPEFQQRMAAARETGQTIAKNDAAAVQTLPKAVTRAEQQLQLIDQMVGTQEVRDKDGNILQAGTAPHPGFKGTVGFGLGLRYVPGTSEASFNALFEQIKGGAFLEAYEMLKGGGAITNIEGEKGTAAITRMSLAQSEQEFVKAARELQEVVRKGVERANKRVDQARQRLGPAAGAAAQATPMGAPTPATQPAPTGTFLGFE
jgi:hypothetical protein